MAFLSVNIQQLKCFSGLAFKLLGFFVWKAKCFLCSCLAFFFF